MGDVKKKTIKDMAAEREQRQDEARPARQHMVDVLASRPGAKDKQISARLNSATYDLFKKICVARGLTANGLLSMLVTDYVRENKHILED